MENMTTLILDDELIVGTATNAYRGASLHPEFQSSSWYISDIDEFGTRKKDPYYISQEDKVTILETLKILGRKVNGRPVTDSDACQNSRA